MATERILFHIWRPLTTDTASQTSLTISHCFISYANLKYTFFTLSDEKDTGFEVSPDEVQPSMGGADDQMDAMPMSSSSDSLSTSDEPDARATLPTPSDMLVSYSTTPGLFCPKHIGWMNFNMHSLNIFEGNCYFQDNSTIATC